MKFIMIAMLLLIYSVMTFAQVVATQAIRNVKQQDQTQIYYNDEQSQYYVDDSPILSFGGYGSTLITGTTTAVGTYFAVQIIADAIIDSLVDVGRDGDAINGVTVIAGSIIFGQNITRIKLTSGTAIAYKRKVSP